MRVHQIMQGRIQSGVLGRGQGVSQEFKGESARGFRHEPGGARVGPGKVGPCVGSRVFLRLVHRGIHGLRCNDIVGILELDAARRALKQVLSLCAVLQCWVEI